METELFNLEKIRGLTAPIKALQGKVNQVSNIVKNLETEQQLASSYYGNDLLLKDLTQLTKLVGQINESLKVVSNYNINKFLKFKNYLINKYKQSINDRLKIIDLDNELLLQIGLSLIENKAISKITERITYIPSVNIKQWLELIDALNQNTLFLKSVDNLREHYKTFLQSNLKKELAKIPSSVASSIVEDFKRQFHITPEITYNKFNQALGHKLTDEEIKSKKELLEKNKERQEIEELKKQQEEQTESYDSYLKFSNKEFERRLRKQKREKLGEISDIGNKKNIEITEEISQKIETFKKQLDRKSEGNYITPSESSEDPLKLIRERKEKKREEYDEFKDHFESD
ncbi:MAG: hypothetical protein KGD74_09150 [Candidatus Lokiarchaeota archaeon]|nr:hypothetical protein [Candidatus Lokiarchaeota archaeon]